MSKTWLAELALLKSAVTAVPNLRNFCTALRLLPPECAYTLGTLYLENNIKQLTMDEMEPLLEILCSRLPPAAGFQPFLLYSFLQHIINDRRVWTNEKCWTWFTDVLLGACCKSPSPTDRPSIVITQKYPGEELIWSVKAKEWLPEGFQVFNPSICGPFILLRTAQYRINYLAPDKPRYETWDLLQHKYGKYTCTKTVNYLWDKSTKDPKEPKEPKEPVQLSTVPVPYPNGTITGLEDMRLFYWPRKQSYYATATSLEITPERAPKQVLVRIGTETGKVSHLSYLKGCPELMLERRKQKNWLPFICPTSGDLCFIYSYCPFIVLRWDESVGRCHVRHAFVPPVPNYWRGSAGPVWLPTLTKWLVLVHESAWPHYCHRFVLINSNMTAVEKWSDRLLFGPDYMIEFSCGMALAEDQHHVTVLYALHDAKAYSVQLPIDYIQGLLANPVVASC